MEHILNWYQLKLEKAEFFRLGIMAFILLIQMNVIVPATLLAISMNGGGTIALGLCAVFSFGLLVLLIGGAHPKITIPLFIVSTLVHLSIVIGYLI